MLFIVLLAQKIAANFRSALLFRVADLCSDDQKNDFLFKLKLQIMQLKMVCSAFSIEGDERVENF